MIEQYYFKPQSQDRIRTCWLAEPIERYVTTLHDQGYSARSIYHRVPILMDFAMFAQARGAKVWSDLAGQVQPFVEQRTRERLSRCRDERTHKHLRASTRPSSCWFSRFSPASLQSCDFALNSELHSRG